MTHVQERKHWYVAHYDEEGRLLSFDRPDCVACGSARGRRDGMFIAVGGPLYPPRQLPLCSRCLSELKSSSSGGDIHPGRAYEFIEGKLGKGALEALVSSSKLEQARRGVRRKLVKARASSAGARRKLE